MNTKVTDLGIKYWILCGAMMACCRSRRAANQRADWQPTAGTWLRRGTARRNRRERRDG
jgi:hypothetical protein